MIVVIVFVFMHTQLVALTVEYILLVTVAQIKVCGVYVAGIDASVGYVSVTTRLRFAAETGGRFG